MPQNEVFEKLRKENHSLRKQLLDVQSKLTKLTETVKALAGSVTNALDECLPEELLSQTVEIDSALEPNGNATTRCGVPGLEPLGSTSCSGLAGDSPFQPLSRPVRTSPCLSETSQVAVRPGTSTISLDWEALSDGLSSLIQPQIPNIWSHQYQMGLQPYARALSESEYTSLVLHKPWIETNSAFSDHIAVLLQLMRTNTENLESQWNLSELCCH